MKKKINTLLNIIIGSVICVFIGSWLYRYWHFQKYPDFYVMQSAPWYTGILMQGFFTLILLAICMIAKVILIEKIKITNKIALILGIVFMTLTFTGGGYVILNHGQVNPGYAVVPGIWTILCFTYYRSKKW